MRRVSPAGRAPSAGSWTPGTSEAGISPFLRRMPGLLASPGRSEEVTAASPLPTAGLAMGPCRRVS